MDDPGSSSEMLDTMVARKINAYLDSDDQRQLSGEKLMGEVRESPPSNFKWKKKKPIAMSKQKLEAVVEANLGESR